MKTENFHELANDLVSKEMEELQHHKDTTIGLYAFDCHPSQLLEKFNNSQSDAHALVCEDFEQLNKDWIKFCNDENVIKSPFFQIAEI